jgi:hypothetical protein
MPFVAAAHAETFHPAVLGRRQRFLAGVVGVGLGFGGPFVLSVALVATSGDMSLLMLPLPFLGALWFAQGFAPAGYRLDGDGVTIERRLRPRLIPRDAIRSVDRERRPLGGLGAVGLNALFGAHGIRWNPWTGWHELAITNTQDLVYVHTRRGLLVLSPDRPDEFAARLAALLAPGGPARGHGRSDAASTHVAAPAPAQEP